MLFTLTSLFVASVLAEFSITDPSNVIDPNDWATDNAIRADFNITPVLYQLDAIAGPYFYSGKDVNISRQYLTVDANDTSVLVITESSLAMVQNTEIVKFGYGSNLFQESFYGMPVQCSKAMTDCERFECSSEHCKLHVGLVPKCEYHYT